MENGNSGKNVQRNSVSAEPQVIELITKPECPLCSNARKALHKVAGDLGVSWAEVSAADQPQRAQKYQEEIPVLLINGRMRDFWVLDENRLRKLLSP